MTPEQERAAAAAIGATVAIMFLCGLVEMVAR